jgi:hypothetical protein
MNSESGRATIAEKYKKDRKGKKEDVALLKKARCHLSSEKFKKIYDVWEGFETLRNPRHSEYIVNSGIGSPTSCFSLNTVSGLSAKGKAIYSTRKKMLINQCCVENNDKLFVLKLKPTVSILLMKIHDASFFLSGQKPLQYVNKSGHHLLILYLC